MTEDRVFAGIALFESPALAERAYDALKELHAAGVIGTYDAAVVSRNPDGKVRIHRREMPGDHGAWSGLAAGAMIGLLFPPALFAAAAGIGTAAGGLAGYLWGGLSRGDLKEMGDAVDEGLPAVVAVGEDRLEDTLSRAGKRAVRVLDKEVDAHADALRQSIDRAIDEARRVRAVYAM